jgi:multicomponent Na+:H+ antiporter subunit E
MILWNVILAFVWTALVGDFSAATFSIGLLIGYLTIAATASGPKATSYRLKPVLVLKFLGYFAKEVIVSTAQVVASVYSPINKLRPGIVAVPIRERDELQIGILANLISYTPGNLSVEVAEDRTAIYVHVLSLTDADAYRKEVQTGYEDRLREIFE